MLFSPLSDSQPYKQLRAITRSELTQPLSTYQEIHHPHTSRFWDCYSLHTTHSQISPDRQYSLAGRSSPDSSVSAFPQSPPNPDICHGWSENCSGWMGSTFWSSHTKNIHSFPKCRRNNSSFWKKIPNVKLAGCVTLNTLFLSKIQKEHCFFWIPMVDHIFYLSQ